MAVRLVVTGHDAQGSSIFQSDEAVPGTSIALVPGFETHELWSTQGDREVPFSGGAPGVPNYFPSHDGSVFRVADFPPTGENLVSTDIDMDEALREAEVKLPGLVAHLEPGSDGMHTTDSVDYGIVLEGEIELELDHGEIRLLKAGDVVVQNGTRHAWRNRSGKRCRMAFILLGARRRSP